LKGGINSIPFSHLNPLVSKLPVQLPAQVPLQLPFKLPLQLPFAKQDTRKNFKAAIPIKYTSRNTASWFGYHLSLVLRRKVHKNIYLALCTT